MADDKTTKQQELGIREQNIIKEAIEKAEKDGGENLKPEKSETVEAKSEKTDKIEDKLKVEKSKTQPSAILAPTLATPQQSVEFIERGKKIEDILASGLEEIYYKMPPDKQKLFKAEGERTGREINNLLEKTKINVKKIINLIKKWLSVIPGVNKFFLEQEAKIKSDKIIELKEGRHHYDN